MIESEDIEQARIRQTVLAIPTSIDVGDFAAAERLFADRVEVDYSSLWGGTAQTMPRADLIGAWRALVPGFDATWHELGPIDLVLDGARATARCAVDARHWLGTDMWRLRGLYVFDLVRAEGWRVALMHFVLEQEAGDRGLVDQARERVARTGSMTAAGAERSA